MKDLLIINLLILSVLNVFSKTPDLNPSDSTKAEINFISPVDIPISLAGNFGELRPGHFHAGLDIRTQGKVGLPIRAIADGYVSRIAISLRGYGKVIYVNHPNGLTSVYAHLRSFNQPLQQFVKTHQYQNQEFVLDLELDSGKFQVKQGEVIGKGGNTGGSAGPHLHFEIRHTQTQTPINPLHFGFEVSDKIAPTIKHLSVYALNDQSVVSGSSKKTYALQKSGNIYTIIGGSIPLVKGKIGFGIETIDKVNLSPFRNGVYKISLFKNGSLVYAHTMDSIPFEETRFINAHVDFPQAQRKKRKVQRSYLLPGNQLSIYHDLVNQGQLFFVDSGRSDMEYRIEDYAGNISKLKFQVQSDQSITGNKSVENAVAKLIYGQANYYENEELKILIPADGLYEDGSLNLGVKPAIGRCVTPRYSINKLSDPLHNYMTLSINIEHIPENQRPNLVIVALTDKSEVLAAEGGEVDSTWISVKTRSFGPYTVMLDTLKPKVNLISKTFGLKQNQRFYFSVKDNISGIGKCEAFINGAWHLVEYEKNRKRAFIEIENFDTSQKAKCVLEISDKVGNKTVKSFDLSF